MTITRYNALSSSINICCLQVIQDAHSEQEEKPTKTRTQSVIFNTSTVGLDKIASNSVININNIVNISNAGTDTETSIINNNNKCIAETFPPSEVEMLRIQLKEQERGMNKLKKQNQLLVEENMAMKKLLETGGESPKPAQLSSSSVVVVKV